MLNQQSLNFGISSAMQPSSKKYAVAVCLSAIFGSLGIHHFYLGRTLHGIIDAGMLVVGLWLIFTGQLLVGILLLAADFIHSLIVTVMLLTGTYKDGDGHIVTYPGQQLKTPNL